jgi:hypothetical protein
MSKVAQAIVNRIKVLVQMSIIGVFESPMERIREIDQVVNSLVAEGAITPAEYNEIDKLIISARSVISAYLK